MLQLVCFKSLKMIDCISKELELSTHLIPDAPRTTLLVNLTTGPLVQVLLTWFCAQGTVGHSLSSNFFQIIFLRSQWDNFKSKDAFLGSLRHEKDSCRCCLLGFVLWGTVGHSLYGNSFRINCKEVNGTILRVRRLFLALCTRRKTLVGVAYLDLCSGDCWALLYFPLSLFS